MPLCETSNCKVAQRNSRGLQGPLGLSRGGVAEPSRTVNTEIRADLHLVYGQVHRVKLMSGRMKPLCCKILLYGIVVGLALTACADFKKDFLCRPNGICPNVQSGHTGIGP